MTTLDSAPGLVTATGPAPHSSLPASPTLTNPDMILPDYPDYDRSPSPVRLDDPRSQMHMWRKSQGDQASGNTGAMYNGQQHHFSGFSAVTPATPIIYGNGTMLSDIGEVTEAESTPGRPSPPHRLSAFQMPSQLLKAEDSGVDAAIRSSPTIGKGTAVAGVKKRAKEHAVQRERRNSSDSNSTITDDRERVAVLADFDDTVSVGDSVFQGDDEESLASSYVDDSSSLAGGSRPVGTNLGAGLNGQKYSTAQLSKRAEQILANAKKRLTTMEDNLSRARSSLIVASPYTESDGSTPSPPIVRASSALIKSTTGPISPAGSRHHRIGSDNSLRIGLPIKVYPQRSSSVLGLQSVSRQPVLTASKSADQLNGQYNRQRTSYIMREAPLEPLGEDAISPSYGKSGLGNLKRYSSITSPTYTTPVDRGLSRSASVTHMRDIKDQVRDLKGKISSLREQARADSLKRRSLQSLRTPSPFTHSYASPWFAESATESEHTSGTNTLEGLAENGETTSSGGGSPLNRTLDTLDENEYDRVSEDIDSPRHTEDLDGEESDQFNYDILDRVPYINGASVEDDNDDMLTENGDTEDVENEGGATAEYDNAVDVGSDVISESGDSIYHESVQEQVSHEDREDAFDYEHFFLHSAMGTISQRLARRDSLSSYTSEGSVETTRGPLGPVAEEEDFSDVQPSPMLSRRASEGSISTIASFATANEDPESRHASIELARDDEEDRIEPETFPLLNGTSGTTERTTTPPTTKRASPNTTVSPSYVSRSEQRNSRQQEELHSTMRRPVSSSAVARPHRPSVSSFESTGTTRSFPLVKRGIKIGSSGIPTPEGGMSDQEAKTVSSSRPSTRNSQDSGSSVGANRANSISLHSTGSATSIMQDTGTSAVMETLPRDDQFLVERLVASLGRCVLGLTENGRASTEARMYRRRIEAARRILEGQLEPAL